jgi:hypothetical protein
MPFEPQAPFKPTLQAPLLATLLAFLAIGCASPGPPRPPSLKLPQPVTDLSAHRIGNQVLLQWTTPSKTTDNLPIKGTLTARICRVPSPAAATPAPQPSAAPCTPGITFAVHPGPSSALENLPPNLTSDPVTLLDYRVEILNSASHAAGLSNSAFAPSGAAPPPVASLRATPTATGVVLQWAPPTSPTSTPSLPDSVELDRTDQTLAVSRQLRSQTTSNPAQPVQLAGKESTEVHLRAKPANPESPAATEPSGTVDATARFGDIYRYTAQRVRTVTLSGHTLDLRSTLSEPVVIAFHDTFPPATPTGLYAVLGQAENTTTAPASAPALAIDLSWQPNTEPDLAGYLVYRRQLPSGSRTSLTSTPIPGPAYRDSTATPGQPYAYSITAIDTSGNESKPSPEVKQTVPSGAP